MTLNEYTRNNYMLQNLPPFPVSQPHTAILLQAAPFPKFDGTLQQCFFAKVVLRSTKPLQYPPSNRSWDGFSLLPMSLA